MKRSLFMMFSILLVVVLLVWAVFYLIVSSQIYAQAERRIELSAAQVMDNLGAELAELEQVSHILSNNERVIAFTQERDTAAYYLLADQISALISDSRVNQEFVGNIIIFGDSGSFFRFSGKLSNTSCTRVRYLAELMDTPEHMAITLEYQNYIGYANIVTDHTGQRTGAVVMLVEEEKLLELISESAMGDSLLVMISARGETVAANHKEPHRADTVYTATRHIGLTPFEIIVSADKQELADSTYYFTIAAIVTALIFGLLIATFVRQMNRRFLSPMLRVMGNVEKLDWTSEGSYLPPVENEEFDSLINQINDMLLRIERQSGEIKTAELRATNAELQKQKAIIFSLKKQINAHFVINTLSSIGVLVEQGNMEQARVILSDLSALIRYAYDKDNMIGIWDELQILEQYITIMNVRYANKIEVVFDLDDRLMDVLIPRMLLQPIVENSIIHGFKNKREGCEVHISATMENRRIIISACDNGAGMSSAKLTALERTLASSVEEVPEGIDNIALINVKRQLHAHYGNGASLEIQSRCPQGTSVVLTIPYTAS